MTRIYVALAFRAANIGFVYWACVDNEYFFKWISAALAFEIIAQSIYPVAVWPWERPYYHEEAEDGQ